MSTLSYSPAKAFVGVCLLCAAVLGGYIYWAVRNHNIDPPVVSRSATPRVPALPPEPAAVPPAPLFPQEKPPAPTRIFFRYNGLGDHYGKLAYVYPARKDAPHFIDALSCEAAYVAGGRGICLSADRGLLTTYAARLFDTVHFRSVHTLPLPGVPSRCRISRDGRMAAYTSFISGHAYSSLDFSTQTLLVDAATGRLIANVEDFSVKRDGQLIRATDFNFWGVTFTPDARRFFCTLSTNQQHFLLEGDIAARSASVIHDNVECPSLSPDGTRVAYKKRFLVNRRVVWQLHILNLKTQEETPLAEKRSVDDQLEWLDDRRVLYALPETETGSSASTNIWVAAADGSSPPELFLAKAYSPSVSR